MFYALWCKMITNFCRCFQTHLQCCSWSHQVFLFCSTSYTLLQVTQLRLIKPQLVSRWQVGYFAPMVLLFLAIAIQRPSLPHCWCCGQLSTSSVLEGHALARDHAEVGPLAPLGSCADGFHEDNQDLVMLPALSTMPQRHGVQLSICKSVPLLEHCGHIGVSALPHVWRFASLGIMLDTAWTGNWIQCVQLSTAQPRSSFSPAHCPISSRHLAVLLPPPCRSSTPLLLPSPSFEPGSPSLSL